MKIEDFNELKIEIGIKEIVEESCDELVKQIKANASKEFKGRGDYVNGWTYSVSQKKDGWSGTVYNKDKPNLPHLLEHGHVVKNKYGKPKRKGKKKRVAPRPHIKPAFDKVRISFEKKMSDALVKIK